ncbi:MAG: hypothetical protein PWP46_1854 [Fusobacteriaceae bacterium]|nr:hypothetical protein [Fusobacteriaceae bacterium]
MQKKIINYYIFIFLFIISTIFFYFLSLGRQRKIEGYVTKSYNVYTDNLAKGISTGYFVWEDMYNAVLNSDNEFIVENIEYLKDLYREIDGIYLIDKDFSGDYYYKYNFQDNIDILIGIFNEDEDKYIKDKMIKVVLDENKILEELELNKEFQVIKKNNKVVLYTKDSKLKLFHIISAISIGLLGIYILNILENIFIKNHYEVDGLRAIVKILSRKDHYTATHSDGVAELANKLGKELGLSKQERRKLYKAALLHDIGKIGIPERILNKPDKLTNDEYKIIKKHPEYSYEIISWFPNLKEVALIARYHHEMIDGSGYPLGLKEKDIPFLSQILAVTDIYNALTTDRPYRKAMSKEKALEIMSEMPINQKILKKLGEIL